jgi:hypothetical protein
MRSPPLRHATVDLDTEHTHLPRRASTLNIPKHIAEDIVPVAYNETAHAAQNARERRLRLLIRRYTNQIQHGCLNRNCSVQTCLSFRRRNTKGPLRPYTDLSARALACHLVEEYGSAGRDPAEGLCRSQPVVPYYQEPGRRQRNTERRSENAAYTNGDLPKPLSQKRPSPKGMDGHVHAPTKPSYEHSHRKHDSLRQETKESPKGPISAGIDDDVEFSLPNRNFPEPRPPLQEPEDSNHAADAAEKKDSASFVQSLWDTLSLRKLQSLGSLRQQQQPHAPDDNGHRRSIHDTSETSPGTRSDSAEDGNVKAEVLPYGDDPNTTAFVGFTLNRLRWQTLTWLIDVKDKSLDHQDQTLDSFLRQSLYHVLSDPQRMYKSSLSWHTREEVEESNVKDGPSGSNHGPGTHHVDPHDPQPDHQYQPLKAQPQAPPIVFNISRSLVAINMLAHLSDGPDQLYSYLHTALQQCYTLGISQPPTRRQHLALKSLKRSGGGLRNVEGLITPPPQSMDKQQVADFFLITLMSMLAPLFSEELADLNLNLPVLQHIAHLRNRNFAYPSINPDRSSDPSIRKSPLVRRLDQHLISTADHFEDWHLLRLVTGLMNCFSHHIAANAILRNQRQSSSSFHRSILELTLDRLTSALPPAESDPEIEVRNILGFGLIELARSVIIKEWDRKPIIRLTSPVGGALQFLSAIHRRHSFFYLRRPSFDMPFIASAFDEMDLPVQWLSFTPNGRDTHILSFPFLFESSTLVKYFRAINVHSMRTSHESASTYTVDASQFMQNNNHIPVYSGWEVLSTMRPHMAKYLVLTIRRSHVLEDAINQLWRRQRREVLRPLRVRLGRDEGEDGLDHGGVQMEFFRLVFAEALAGSYGMFTIDPATHMTWFQPGSLEPLYKFEVLGLLMGLAVYNAVTLPVTFPLAFYRKLLGMKNRQLEDVRDGWPELAKGLQGLLEHEGDVEEDIGRTYEFSYEFGGEVVSVDMLKEKRARDAPWSGYAGKRHETNGHAIGCPPRNNTDSGKKGKGKEKAKSSGTKSATFELPVSVDVPVPKEPITPSASTSASPSPQPARSRTSSLKDTRISPPLSLSGSSSPVPELQSPKSNHDRTVDADDLGPESEQEAPPVTSSNRHKYVADYIKHLTQISIAPQFSTFHKGFTTIISPKSITLFSPEQLQTLVEGHREIKLEELMRTARYEEYERDSEYMKVFWEVVSEMASEDPGTLTKLLEFVTASDRVPVNGLQSVQFIIQRNGGVTFEPNAREEQEGSGAHGDATQEVQTSRAETEHQRLDEARNILQAIVENADEWADRDQSGDVEIVLPRGNMPTLNSRDPLRLSYHDLANPFAEATGVEIGSGSSEAEAEAEA